MLNTYSDELIEAQRRTIRFHLNCPQIALKSEQLLTLEKRQQLPKVIFDLVGNLGLQDIVAQCLDVHYFLRAPMEQMFGVSIIYTIGYVYIPPIYAYKQTESELLQLLQTGVCGLPVDLHAWLTLPSMEIIDFTLLTSIAVAKGWEEGKYEVIADHSEENKYGIRYHPMLLGEDYLRKIGVLTERRVLQL